MSGRLIIPVLFFTLSISTMVTAETLVATYDFSQNQFEFSNREGGGTTFDFVNHQVTLVVGYMKGDKWKSIVIDDYEVDPAMMGITFELKAIKEATPMGPICWGYWVNK